MQNNMLQKNVPFSHYAVIYLFFGLKELIKVKRFNYVITFSFFLKMPKIWVSQKTVKGKKKGMVLWIKKTA